MFDRVFNMFDRVLSHSRCVCKICSLSANYTILHIYRMAIVHSMLLYSQKGHTDVVDILLRKEADVNQTTTDEVCATINLCVYHNMMCILFH